MNSLAAYRWTGEVLDPLPRFVRVCNETFVVGEVYTLVTHEERSGLSHRHYFASIREAWMSLRDDAADRLRSPEALRKFALIKAGYADSQSITCASKAEAQRVAAFIRPVDEFAAVTVAGATVTRWTAKSQSMRAMGKAEFQASKDAVLDVLADMLGTTPRDLEQARAA